MALPHARGDVEDRAPLDHRVEHAGDAWVVRIDARGVDRCPRLVRRGRVGPGLPGQQRHVRDHVDAGPHHVEGQRGEHRQVRPDGDPLAVGLGHDRRDQVGREVGVHLDRTGVGAPGERGGDDEVGLVGDRLHPGHLARRLALGDLPGTGIVEEAGPGHQGGVVDVGAGDLTDQAGASEVADLPEVVGHVPDRGDAAVDHLAQPRLRLDAVRRGGEVLVGVDQSGDHEPAGEVDHLGAVGDDEPSGLDDVDDAILRRPRATCRPTAPRPSRRRSSRRGRRPPLIATPRLPCVSRYGTLVTKVATRGGPVKARPRRCPCPVPRAPPSTRPSTSSRPSPTATGPSASASWRPGSVCTAPPPTGSWWTWWRAGGCCERATTTCPGRPS